MQRTPGSSASTHSPILTEKDETGTHCQSSSSTTTTRNVSSSYCRDCNGNVTRDYWNSQSDRNRMAKAAYSSVCSCPRQTPANRTTATKSSKTRLIYLILIPFWFEKTISVWCDQYAHICIHLSVILSKPPIAQRGTFGVLLNQIPVSLVVLAMVCHFVKH